MRKRTFAIFIIAMLVLYCPSTYADSTKKRQDSSARRSWLGVVFKNTNIVVASDIFPDSPAEKGGLKAGDIILSFNGKPVESADSLSRSIAAMDPGSEVAIEVLREGKRIVLGFVLSKFHREEWGLIDGVYKSNNGVLKLKPLSVNKYSIDIEVHGGKIGAGPCLGQLHGVAIVDGGKLKIIQTEEGEPCYLSIAVRGNSVVVVENSCSYYHGVACDFSGEFKMKGR